MCLWCVWNRSNWLSLLLFEEACSTSSQRGSKRNRVLSKCACHDCCMQPLCSCPWLCDDRVHGLQFDVRRQLVIVGVNTKFIFSMSLINLNCCMRSPRSLLTSRDVTLEVRRERPDVRNPCTLTVRNPHPGGKLICQLLNQLRVSPLTKASLKVNYWASLRS